MGDLSAKSWIAFALRLGISGAIFAACLTLLDVSMAPTVLARVSPALLALAFVVTVVGTIVLPAIVTKRALKIERLNFRLHELVLINFAIRFYVLVLPRAASIGIRWLRYRQRGSGHDALALMAFERLTQLFIMTTIGLAALCFEMAELPAAAFPIAVIMAVVVLLLAVTLSAFLAPASAPWLRAVTRIADRLAPPFVARRTANLLSAIEAFQRLGPGTIGYIVMVSAASYALFILAPYMLAIALQLEVSLVALAWVRPVVFILTLLPFTVAGLGIREAGFIGLLHLYGVLNHEALALSIAIFFVQIAIGLVGAAVELWRYGVAPTLAGTPRRPRELNE